MDHPVNKILFLAMLDSATSELRHWANSRDLSLTKSSSVESEDGLSDKAAERESSSAAL